MNFADDARALATCDWDFDGKLDLWMSARTAPRVRYVRNEMPQTDHFVAFQLRGNGTSTNRDAIGARVELHLDGQQGQSIRTLHAGDGFLTQSSRWIHFGIGQADRVDSFTVHWPGGTEVQYAGVPADGFFLVDQASGAVTAWQPPKRTLAAKTALPSPQPPLSSRIVLPSPLPLPALEFTEGDLPVRSDRRATLLTVWSATCPHCVGELKDWSQVAAKFAAQGIEVVAVNADLDATSDERRQIRKLLADMNFAFQARTGTSDTLRRLDYFQRALMDVWQPMPVPCSFLLDEFGQVTVVYKGPVNAEQVWQDTGLTTVKFEQLLEEALPFPGRWAGPAPVISPLRVSSQLVDHKLLPDAVEYLQAFLNTSKQRQATVGDASAC